MLAAMQHSYKRVENCLFAIGSTPEEIQAFIDKAMAAGMDTLISWDGKKFESSRLLIGGGDCVWAYYSLPECPTTTELRGAQKTAQTIKTILIRDAHNKVVAKIRISGTATSGVAAHTGPGNSDENFHKVMQTAW